MALAIQYGHLRTALDHDESGRYGSRSRQGIHGLIDVETALATADAAADLHDRFQNGEGISGPAAAELCWKPRPARCFAGRRLSSTSPASTGSRVGTWPVTAASSTTTPTHCYKRDRALCERDGHRDAPSLDRCVAGCGNIVRTNQHAALLRERATHLEHKAARLPGPIGDRLRHNAARLRGWADEHDRTRFTRQETTA
ncbi:hypothetical protein [Streptantibioticus ferralitis]|uniref:Uncharacterized protein n=1 Tax=Streptantibioticus ferralitis TaxID=236510 RepID=A0ABT5Z8E6_9ACTN|nr:hypothetical protein [Streptantibioticus ferralitis]MDF2260091.1 hypothetical protein [Streptantibioticus ferralitis]